MTEEVKEKVPSKSGFAVGSYWELLSKKDTHFEEQSMIIDGIQFRPPTLSASHFISPSQGNDSMKFHPPKKLNYSEIFDRPPFISKAYCLKVDRYDKPIIDHDGKFIYELRTHQKTVPNMDSLRKMVLDYIVIHLSGLMHFPNKEIQENG